LALEKTKCKELSDLFTGPTGSSFWWRCNYVCKNFV
jgi:hypothetical protein